MPATPLPSFRPRAPHKRPVYLVVALLLVWVVGLFGATEGCQTIDVLHRPDAVRRENNRLRESGRPPDGEMVRRREALIDTVLAFRRTVTPLAIGQLLLGSVLTLSAGLTLLGRGQARRIALQAIVIYALFLPIDYFARRPMRASAIEAIADGAPLPGFEAGASPEGVDQRVFFWWVYRGALGLQLVILTLGLFAMTRPRVRAFWSAMGGEPSGGDEP